MNAFPDDSPVLVRFPLTPEQARGDREALPWVPGMIIRRCGPDEWDVLLLAPELEDAEGTFPLVFRDASELRRA
jgi:hypothetical protein